MPDLPTIAGGPSEVASTPTTSSGIVLTANASINTKATTWTELVTATTYDANWVMVTLTGVGTATASYLVDVGVGASTAEQVLIPNLATNWPAAGTVVPRCFLFPLRIPKGTRISARCQSTTTVATVVIGLHVIATPISAPPGLDRLETAGIITASSLMTALPDPGAVAHTDGTWGELIASTGFAYKWLCVCFGNTLDVSFVANLTHLVDIAVGAGGSEVAIINDLLLTGGTNNDCVFPGTYCFPVAIAGGTRIAARHRSSSGTASDRRLEMAAWGVG